MLKDGVDFDFHFYIGGKNIPAKIKKDSKRCYLKRQLDAYTHSVFTKIKHESTLKSPLSGFKPDNIRLAHNPSC